MNIDLSSYKRLFTIGCSFTEYWFPTWPWILLQSMPNAQLFNLGKSGTSNSFIANRLVEANYKFKFCKTDLVMIMWTTTARETHYVKGTWVCPGNIYNQDHYDENFVRKFADPEGYLIRDLAIMDLATKYVNSLDCTYIGMLSTPLTFDFIEDPRWHREEKDSIIKPALELYKPLIDSFPPSLYEWEMEGQWDTTIQYYVDWKKEIFIDYHPSPVRHYNYLKKINIPITEKSKKFAEDTLIKIHSGNNRNDFVTLFPECHNYRVENMWGK